MFFSDMALKSSTAQATKHSDALAQSNEAVFWRDEAMK